MTIDDNVNARQLANELVDMDSDVDEQEAESDPPLP